MDKKVSMMMKGGMDIINQRMHVQVGNNVVKSLKFASIMKYLGVNVGANIDFQVHMRGMRQKVIVITGKL